MPESSLLFLVASGPRAEARRYTEAPRSRDLLVPVCNQDVENVSMRLAIVCSLDAVTRCIRKNVDCSMGMFRTRDFAASEIG